MGGLSGESNSGLPGRRNVLKVTETEAMKRKRKYRDSKKNSLSSLIVKEEPTQVNTA